MSGTLISKITDGCRWVQMIVSTVDFGFETFDILESFFKLLWWYCNITEKHIIFLIRFDDRQKSNQRSNDSDYDE